MLRKQGLYFFFFFLSFLFVARRRGRHLLRRLRARSRVIYFLTARPSRLSVLSFVSLFLFAHAHETHVSTSSVKLRSRDARMCAEKSLVNLRVTRFIPSLRH